MRYLVPADYGVIAILDLTAGVVGVIIGSGMGAALNRYHFNEENDRDRNRIWWTGLTFVALLSTAIVLSLSLFRETLAHITLGSAVKDGGFFYALLLPTIWFSSIGQLCETYLRARKWSGVSVGIALIRLVLNMGLNLYFLIALQWSITGVLLGNLITGATTTVFVLVIMVRCLGRFVFHWPLLPKLWRFGTPLVATSLLSIIMHQSDRYFILLFLDLDHVGVYSLAYTVGQGINTLVLVPFAAIWNVTAYEIAQRENARRVYAQVFECFFYGLALIMLGVALFARPIIGILVPSNYIAAADLIPIICLAYIFFSFHEHFKVPVMLARRTSELLPVFVITVFAAMLLNLSLIPLAGIVGAAYASLLSFVTFSFAGLWRYRRVERYEYPLKRCLIVLTGLVLTYVGYEKLSGEQLAYSEIGTGIMVWVIWGIALFKRASRIITGPSVVTTVNKAGAFNRVRLADCVRNILSASRPGV
jgi:O-antigen/teichoic acid export membrane protein